MKKKNDRFVDSTSMSESTKKQIKKRGITIRKDPKKKYSKWERNKVVYTGYNCFENFVIVRKYIQKVHKIDYSILETLLYLFPKGFFTYTDYAALDKQLQIASVKRLMEIGLAKRVADGGGNVKALYSLTKKSTIIVTDFYETLMGQKPFNVVKAEKLFDPNKKGDMQTLNIIKKLDSNF